MMGGNGVLWGSWVQGVSQEEWVAAGCRVSARREF